MWLTTEISLSLSDTTDTSGRYILRQNKTLYFSNTDLSQWLCLLQRLFSTVSMVFCICSTRVKRWFRATGVDTRSLHL